MTDKVLQEDHWFNEPIELPEAMKEYYREIMDEQNAELVKKGLPMLEEWAK